MRPSAAILYRDATRLSRRWQTYALRAGFSGLLLALVLVVIWFLTEFQQQFFDPGRLGDLGRFLFTGFAAVQVALAAVVAPHAAASAVIEEREQGTVEVLLLTRLTARQMLLGKVASRLLVIASLILGALPVLAVVTSLGGVSVIEVLAICAHALATVMVLGAMGAFFGIFTRSPTLATLAAVGYGTLAFLLMPALAITLVPFVKAPSWVSPLFGTLSQDWASLLPLATYTPPAVLTILLGARLYELRVSGRTTRQFFDGPVWSATAFQGLALATFLLGITLIPLVLTVGWVLELSMGGPWVLVTRTILYAWAELVLLVCTWAYLRVTTDVVEQVDSLLAPKHRVVREGGPRVWGNPVAWRELHGGIGRQVGPAIGAWALVLLAIGVTALWIVPGALLVMGGVTVALGIAQASWLMANEISSERADGSLSVLLTTTLGSPSVVFGKLGSVLAATSVFVLGGLPLVLLGAPHLQLLFLQSAGSGSLLGATFLGLLACLWLLLLWLFVSLLAMATALGLSRPNNAAPLVLGFVSAVLLLPAMASASLPPRALVQVPLRLLAPVLVTHPTWWEIGLSSSALSVATFVLFVLCCVKLRPWGTADVA